MMHGSLFMDKCGRVRQPSLSFAVYPVLQTTCVMQRTPSASRSTIILTSGIISALLSAALFCLAYLVL